MTSEAADAPHPSRQRRPRGAAESLGGIVLAFESIVVFLGGLVVYGLKALPAGVEPWWGIVAGAVLAVLMLLVSRVLARPWGIPAGWVLQGVLVLSGLLVPALAFVGLVFGALWGYATIKGASLDRRNARLAAEGSSSPAPNGD